MKKYAEPELEYRRVTVAQTMADDMSGDDNDLDISDTGWENADL